MKLTKKQEREIMQVYDTWLNSYLNGDVKTYDSFLDVDYRFIGSTNNEEFLNKKDTTNFFKATADQLAGKTEIRNSIKTVKQLDGLIFITDLFDAYFLKGDDWAYYGRFRFTSAMRKNKNGWRFMYQHFSTPDSKAQEGETLGTEQITKENQELRDAIKRRTVELEQKNRELQIEAALERVRARAMAMQSSDELSDLVDIVFKELTNLDFALSWCIINIIDEPSLSNMVWGANTEIGKPPESYYMKFEDHRFHHEMLKAYQERLSKWVFELKGKEKEEYDDYLFNQTEFKRVSDSVQKEMRKSKKYVASFSFSDFGGLQTIGEAPLSDANLDILARFGKVFDLTYTRFNDLKLAEAQAREAQIELALERVRARTMAMQKSDELKEVIQVVYDQFVHLNINIEHTGFIIDYKVRNDMHIWLTDRREVPSQVTIPYFDTAHWNSFIEAKQNGTDFFTNKLDFEEKNRFYKELFELIPGVPDETIEYYLKVEGLAISTVLLDDVGLYIENFDGIPYTDDENKILMRFGKVFQQTYTRFLDLKKAEAQAREAQIETAMERIRSCAIAMRTSDELLDVAIEIRRQTDLLGQQDLEASVVHLYEKDAPFFESLVAIRPPGDDGEITTMRTKFPVTATREIKQMMKNYWSGLSEYTIEINQKMRKEWQKVLLKYIPEINSQRLQIEENVKPEDLIEYWNFADFSGGSLLSVTYSPSTLETKELFKRSAEVFDLAYRRYMDLQKAEAQTREAQIEVSLERVRARSMAMHKSEELIDTATLLYQELSTLGIRPYSTGFVLVDKKNERQELWFSAPGGKNYMDRFFLPLKGDAVLDERYRNWKNKESIFYEKVEGEILNQHLQFVSAFYGSREAEEQAQKFPECIFFYCGYFPEGYLHILTETILDAGQESIMKRFTQVFAMTYRRFLDLQKAEAQTREAQIENALEKVRSRTMAMHKSEELAETALVLYEQFTVLGNIPDRMSIGVFKEETKEIELWGTDQSGSQLNQRFTGSWKRSSVMTNLYKAWKSGNDSFLADLSGQKLNAWLKYIREEMKLFVDDSHMKGRRMQQAAFFSHGMLLFTTNEPITEEVMQLLIRFARVFSQTYTRFLDLQKAEAQAREAQIENTLEKVRSRTMAMQKSEELPEAANNLFLQVQALGIPAWSAGYCIWETEDKKTASCNMSSEGEIQKSFILPTIGDGYNFYAPLQKGETFYVEELGGGALIKHYDFMRTLPTVGEILDELINAGISLPTFQIFHIVYFPQGYLMFITYEQVPDAHEIFKRFANVFEQTYTRFLDLKKAEAQAREAQIEGALERVRSKTMAMHNSEDLEDIVVSLFDEVLNLGIDKSIRCGIGILEDYEGMETRSVNSNSDGAVDLRVGMLNMTIHPMLVSLKKAWKNGSKGYSYEYTGKDVKKYYEALNNEPEYPFNANLKTLPEREFHQSFFFSSGILFTFSEAPVSEESSRILARFAAVFGQTYRRFLDLQKAEAQAREATKQASLDRVRGQIASMRTAADLDRITPLVWNELTTMSVPFIRCGVFIIDEPTEIVEVYLSAPDGHSLGVLHLQFNADPLTANTVAHWRKGSILKEHWNREGFISWTQSLMEQGQISDKNTYQGAAEPPESLDLHFIPFTQGMLYVGSENPLNDKQIDLVQSLADAFAIAYARYEDFTKLEKAKQSVETTLNELKATQNQLVQSEKMASLGELTAGIAHEIQNPLNFVNNFSEVSNELIDEMNDEIEKGDLKEAKAIANDIKQNLEKINHHGKRADGIVKGMLQHSRSSSGQKEPTDINALTDEYLRLAYHGLRAKDKSFNATMNTDFDKTIGSINVVPQDLGRVILNLLTNAFYIVNEKKQMNIEGYKPTVSVSTKKEENHIIISVQDNGNGIPKKVLEKIFQPFFTTKPTGQGTGLGLSMSYDIITKGHGGELKVETKENLGSTFIISLPKI